MPGVAIARTRLAPRLEPADARSRRCQHPPATGGRTCALRRLGPHAHSRCWTHRVVRHGRRCLHATPPSSARRAGSHPASRAAFSVAVARFEAGRLVVTQGGFLRCASSAAGFGRSRFLHPNLMRSRGREPGAWTAPARGRPPAALRQPAWGRVRLRVRPGACLTCPPSFGGGSFHLSPTFPPAARSESPSAVSGAYQEPRQAPPTASVGRRGAASRPSPSGGLAARP